MHQQHRRDRLRDDADPRRGGSGDDRGWGGRADLARNPHDVRTHEGRLHGTSTQQNDKMETMALKKCFNSRSERIPMSSTKSMIGHPQGACGAAGLAATVLGMRIGRVHPTINYDAPDPECDLDYVPNESRKANVDVALCNCIAFGSKNSALVVTKHAP